MRRINGQLVETQVLVFSQTEKQAYFDTLAKVVYHGILIHEEIQIIDNLEYNVLEILV